MAIRGFVGNEKKFEIAQRLKSMTFVPLSPGYPELLPNGQTSGSKQCRDEACNVRRAAGISAGRT